MARTDGHAEWRYLIEQDTLTGNPRDEWDQLGRLVVSQRWYTLSWETDRDVHGLYVGDLLSTHDVRHAIRYARVFLDAVALPVSYSAHGPMPYSVGDRNDDADGWGDGLIYVPRSAVREAWGGEYPGDDTAEEILRAEVAELNRYLSGDVWGYVVERWTECVDSCPHCPGGHWVEVDSLWGMYGRDYCESEAVAALAAAKED